MKGRAESEKKFPQGVAFEYTDPPDRLSFTFKKSHKSHPLPPSDCQSGGPDVTDSRQNKERAEIERGERNLQDNSAHKAVKGVSSLNRKLWQSPCI